MATADSRFLRRLPTLSYPTLLVQVLVVAALSLNCQPAQVVMPEPTLDGDATFQSLISNNTPPPLSRDQSGYQVAAFPADFNWEDYRRVRTAIEGLEKHADVLWDQIVEHMTDAEYCITIESYGSARNETRGRVCYRLARTWINRGYIGLMPTEHLYFKYLTPKAMDPEELQAWCQARRNKRLDELQIEAAEWASSFISSISGQPDVSKNEQDTLIRGIRERIKTLRESHKAIPGRFFVPDCVLPYTEEREARRE